MYRNSFWRRILGLPKPTQGSFEYSAASTAPVPRRKSTALMDYCSVLLAFFCLLLVLSEKYPQLPETLRLSVQETVTDNDVLPRPVSAYGASIDEIAANLRGLPYEVAVCFDEEGNFLTENTDYSASNVTIMLPAATSSNFWESLTRPRPIILHNHPANVPFSLVDLETAESCNAAVFVAVSSDYTYIMKPPKVGWPSAEAINEWRNSRFFQDSFLVNTGSYQYGSVRTFYATDQLMHAYASYFRAEYTKYDVEQSIAQILQLQ